MSTERSNSDVAKPCPFCGSDEIRLYHEQVVPSVVFLYCEACEMHGPESTTVEGAQALWNRRLRQGEPSPQRIDEGLCATCPITKEATRRMAMPSDGFTYSDHINGLLHMIDCEAEGNVHDFLKLQEQEDEG